MAKQWRIAPHDAARVNFLARAAGLPVVVAQMLSARGVTTADEARMFLDARLSSLRNPELLPGVTRAADLLFAAVQAERKIVVYGDYDVDGMSGAALLAIGLRLIGASVATHVPHRLEEGYGLHCESLRALAERGAQTVVTVDCGITSAQQALTARQLGLQLIITDHHELADQLPDADALVHPRLPGHAYPFAGLCGAGVAFKLMWALCQRASGSNRVAERLKNYLLQALGLVALGTIADCVPLIDENRILAKHGLDCLKTYPTLGIGALLKATKLTGRDLKSEDVAFTLAPRLNAAGRLGQAALGVELLTTDSPDRAEALAEYLNELNGSRDSLERSVYLAARKQAEELYDPEGDAALVLADRGWHVGVLGIVAGRLAEKYHRPVVVLSLDSMGGKPAVGSGRSVPGFGLHEALGACREHLVSHGGHAAAAGLKVDEACLEMFRQSFVEYAATEIAPAARVAELRIDAETPISALTMEAVTQLEQLAPFGQGNFRPVLCTSNVSLAEPPKRIGGGERHLSLRLVQHGVAIRGVAFGGAEWAPDLAAAGEISIAFRPIINEYRGRRSVELQLCDWRLEPIAATIG